MIFAAAIWIVLALVLAAGWAWWYPQRNGTGDE